MENLLILIVTTAGRRGRGQGENVVGYVVLRQQKTENHARQWRKVRYAVVHGDARWECESCDIGKKRKGEI
jgi:hypothetical protein